jgi:hypothetical protein
VPGTDAREDVVSKKKKKVSELINSIVCVYIYILINNIFTRMKKNHHFWGLFLE